MLKPWLITALGIGRTSKQLTDCRESGLLFNHSHLSPSALLMLLWRVQSGNHNVWSLPGRCLQSFLLISVSQPLPWACPRQREKRMERHESVCMYLAPELLHIEEQFSCCSRAATIKYCYCISWWMWEKCNMWICSKSQRRTRAPNFKCLWADESAVHSCPAGVEPWHKPLVTNIKNNCRQ